MDFGLSECAIICLFHYSFRVSERFFFSCFDKRPVADGSFYRGLAFRDILLYR